MGMNTLVLGSGLLHLEGVPPNPLPNTPADKMKFIRLMQEVCELIRGIVLKNQEGPQRRAEKYYVMRTCRLPLNLWVWVYNPRAAPPEEDKLDNSKLHVAWAGPYLFKGMDSEVMARIGKIDKSRQVVRRFLVHGSRVRLCHLGGLQEDNLDQLKVRPSMLPDFPDSEASGPLYQVEDLAK